MSACDPNSRRRIRPYDLAMLKLPASVRDLRTLLLGYVPAGFCVNCMNLHLQLALTLAPPGDSETGPIIPDIGIDAQVLFSPASLLYALPAQFLFKNYSYLLAPQTQERAESSPGEAHAHFSDMRVLQLTIP